MGNFREDRGRIVWHQQGKQEDTYSIFRLSGRKAVGEQTQLGLGRAAEEAGF